MSHPLRILFFTLFLLVAGPLRCLAWAEEAPSLLAPLLQAQASVPAGSRAVARASLAEGLTVAVDFTVVDPAGLGPQEITVMLPDQTITIRKLGVERRGSGGGYTWHGTVVGSELSTVVLTVEQEVIFGSIDFDGLSYSLGTENGSYRVHRKDPSRRGSLVDDTLLPPLPAPAPQAARALTAQPLAVATKPAEDGSRIDLLILYAPGLQSVYGAGVATKIQHLVDLANTGFINSGVSTRLNLVGSRLYDHPAIWEQTEANTVYVALDHVAASPEVAALRDQYKADLVSLLREFHETRLDGQGNPVSQPCGLGYIMTPPAVGPAFASSAFSVVEVKDIPPAGGTYCDETTLIHELGHNMGCAHDRDQGGPPNGPAAPGAYRYSYGYDVAGLFGTIMSYDGPTITYFSTPLKSYQSQPIGKADLLPGGTVQQDSADNARTINTTRAIVANFRNGLPPCAEAPFLTVPTSDPDGAYTVSWGASPTAGVSYLLEEATDRGFTSGVRTAYSGPDLSAAIVGRTFGKTYFYRVKAILDGFADSEWTPGDNGCTVKIALAAAVESSGLTWSTGGGARWFGQPNVSQYGGDAAQSGGIGNGQNSWLQTTVTGPGTLSFQWRVSSEPNFDLLDFTVDGAKVAVAPSISGEVDWLPVTVKILSAGSHALRWAYTKDQGGGNGVDAGWVDRVRWLPPCATPAGITVPASSLDGTITVSWGASATAGVNYVLEQATESTFGNGLQTVYSGPALIVSLGGRAVGNTYFYRVKAEKTDLIDSPWQIGLNGCVVLEPRAVAPPSLTVPVKSGSGSFQVSWGATPTPGAITYLLQEARDRSFTTGLRTVYRGSGLSSPVTVNPATLMTYYYRVKATTSGFTPSPWRKGFLGCAVPGKSTPPPSSLTVPLTAAGGSLQVEWGSSTPSAGVSYLLQEARDSAFSTGVRNVYDGPGQNVALAGRTPGEIYYYRVKATKSGYTYSAWLTGENGCAMQ